MPELPEVEAARRYVEKFCLGLTIRKVYTKEVGGGPRDGLFDEIVLDTPLTELQVQKSLVGRKISNVHRKGKQLWIEFSGGDLVAMFHFGMTGSILMQGHDIPLYFRSNSNDFKEWPPKFTKFMVEFSDGTNLAFRDPRRLGRIKIVQPEECQQVLRKLAIDPTTMQIPNPTMIRKQLRGLTAPIKAVLLDQERIFCGIGNYLADEILYQARIHPSSKACALSEAHLAAMIVSMQSILKIAIDAGADYKLFPADWLFHARWSKAKSKTSKISLPNGRAIVFEEVGGRTTAVVPSVQVKVTEESGGRGAKTEPAVTDVDAEESPLLKSVAVKAKPRKRKLDAAADCHQQVSAKEPNVDLREVASPVGAAMETRAKKTKEVARSRMALK